MDIDQLIDETYATSTGQSVTIECVVGDIAILRYTDGSRASLPVSTVEYKVSRYWV